MLRADRTEGHRVAVAEGAADREAEMADPDLVRVGEADGDERFVLGVDLEEREVGLRIGAHHLRGELAAVGQADPEGLAPPVGVNHHVVDADGRRQTLRVRLADGREFPAKVVGTDSETDLALLKIDPKDESLIPIRFANSDQVRVGHLCLAIGSPFGYSHSVTFGTVSAKHRHAQLSQPYQDFIQTDAPINPGNSGGALVNIKGELIGINAAIVSETRGSDGVGLAIASNLVKFVSDQLQKYGRVRRGFLGIKPMDLEEALAGYGIKTMEELLQDVGLKSPRGVFVDFV